jgi:hypothetical protein
LNEPVAHIIYGLPQIKVKVVLAKLNGGPSGGHLGVNKSLDKITQR